MAKGKDVLIDDHVSLTQCEKAVDALLAHATKKAAKMNEKELLSDKEENIWLVLAVKKVTPEKKLKPFKIPVAHPIIDPRSSPVCLITKDPQREYKDLLASHNIKFISRVVGITKLKGKFKPFEARRMLLKENELFLADDRVVPLLPQLLGRVFFDAKKQPLPVSLTTKNLKKELEQAISSTYMHQNKGTCTSVKMGTIAQPSDHIVDNLGTALPAIAKRIHGGWDNIQSLHIKSNSSTSLPIWTCELDEGANGRWEASKVNESESWSGVGNDEPAEEAEAEPPSKKDGEAMKTSSQKETGKKRSARDTESQRPQKRSKTAERNDEPAEEALNDLPIKDGKATKTHSRKEKNKERNGKDTDSTKLQKKPTRAEGRAYLDEVAHDESPNKEDGESQKTFPQKEKGKKRGVKDVESQKPQDDLDEVAHDESPNKEDGESQKTFPQKEKGKKRGVKVVESQKPQEQSKTAEVPVAEARIEPSMQKKINKGIGKKKEKVLKGKASGSVKESVVGRKSKSRN